jgi:outer membrane lipoprotein-sorting protein
MNRERLKPAVIPALLLALSSPLRAADVVRAVARDSVLAETLARMRRRLDSIRDYRCLYASAAVKGPRREESVMKYFYKKPGLIRAEIIDGAHQGTILIAREGKVRAQPAGILSAFVFKFPADHPRVTDPRGNRLEETSWEFFVDEHLARLDLLRLLSARRETLDGEEALVLEAASADPARTRGIAREVLWVSVADDVLLRVEMHDARGLLVQEARFTDIILDPGLPDSLFERISRR